MNRRRWCFLLLGLLLTAIPGPGQDDPGKASIGTVRVLVYYATDEDPSAAGPRAKEISPELVKRLQREERLRFRHYRLLGEDVQELLRSYENWAQPLKPSDEILVRFEARSQPSPEAMLLDLELWLARKKILKTDALLKQGRPLHVLGPVWRGGRLIISVALAPEAN